MANRYLDLYKETTEEGPLTSNLYSTDTLYLYY